MADIYENEVVSMLDNDFKSLKSIALKSYRFASTNDEFDDEYADDQWLVLSKHNTFSSYLIAYHIRTTLEEYETTKNIEPLLRFYPSLIVSFVDDYLEKNASLQRAVVKIINERYQELDDMHRARLIFWAAHVKNENLRNEICEFVLNELKRVSPLVINSRLDGDDISEGNRCLQILYRILSQTALEFGKTSYIDDFLCNLLISDQANSMNKGYLLFYYGDIHADFTEVSMHFADRPELGLRTINKLDDILHYELIETNSNRPVELFLFSFFSLLQTRIECGSADVEDIDLVEMCKNAIKYYTHYKRKQSVITSRKIKFYFEGICEDFKEFIESKQKINIACSILNPMLDPELTPRANWQRVKTKRVETVAEHLYGAFLIGLVLLPQRDPSQEGYSKKEILDMLLLHDLGEVKVGDHDILASDQEKMFYDTQEDAAIRTLFEKGTYTQIANLSIYYSQWSTFQNAMDINAKIAHDIDVIHTIYRFSLYYVASEENFNEKEIDAFLNYREQIMTEVGWKIYNSVVRDNPSFNSIKDKLEL